MIDDEILRKAQLKMVDILVAIDKICKEHKIEYWLSYGTLLGAVRHKGFIPWDDDCDICMMRSDYEKFKKFANELPENIFLGCGPVMYFSPDYSVCQLVYVMHYYKEHMSKSLRAI